MFNTVRDKPHATKKRRIVGSEKGCKATTNLSLVLLPGPCVFFKDQLDQISNHQKDQEEDQDNVDIDRLKMIMLLATGIFPPPEGISSRWCQTTIRIETIP